MAKNHDVNQLDNRAVISVQVNARKIALVLGIVALILACISFTAQLLKYSAGIDNAYGMIPTMDVDRELSVPSKFSVQLLFLVVLLVGLISLLKQKEKDPFRWQWIILSLGFLFMAFDEGSSIHEMVTMPIRHMMGDDLPDFLLFSWVIPAIVIVAVLVVYYLKFVLSLPKRTKTWLLLSAAVYLGGLLVMEMVGSYYAGQEGIKNLTYNLIVTIEETLEMLGTIAAIYTFLDYIDQTFGEIKLDI